MRKTGTLFACMALLTFGCDDSRTMDDGGGIVLMDSGPRTDSGPVGVDSGPSGSTCSVAGASGFPSLPAGCLPRCSAATQSTAAACMDNACVTAALNADTTPGTTVDLGMGMSNNLDCSGCYNWQINSCIFDSCSAEFSACAMCPDTTDFCNDTIAGCEAQETALDGCITTNTAAIQSCATTRASACFSTTGGFLPDFGELPNLVTPERLQMILTGVPSGLPL